MFNYMICMLQNSNIINYIKNYSAAYDEIVIAVQEILHLKFLSTLILTFYHINFFDKQISVSLLSQHITWEKELDDNNLIDQHKNLFVESYEYSSSAVWQELNQKSRSLYHAYVKNTNNSEIKQMISNSQCSANLNTWFSSDYNNNIYDQNICQNNQLLEQIIMLSVFS